MFDQSADEPAIAGPARRPPASAVATLLPTRTPGQPAAIHAVLELQRRAGNAAVSALLGAAPSAKGRPGASAAAPAQPPRMVQRCGPVDPAACGCHAGPEAPLREPEDRPLVLSAPVQRTLAVHTPAGAPVGAPAGTTNEDVVRQYVSTLCPDFTVAAGMVRPRSTARGLLCDHLGAGILPGTSCRCLCRMHRLPAAWTIQVDDTQWPHTDAPAEIVTVHSGYSGIEFGAWARPHRGASRRMREANWLVLGHELCGHADLHVRGRHPAGGGHDPAGRRQHDVTVRIENRIAREHGIPSRQMRGLYADPHHGESFGRLDITGFAHGAAALTPPQLAQAQAARTFITANHARVDVIGHSDPTEPAAVATTRATTVRQRLHALGVLAGRFMTVQGVGSTECAAVGNPSSCRKVEVFMFGYTGASLGNP